jgi:hypothetical protein
VLTDSAWADIVAAAAPFTPDGEARAVLSAILFEEYPAFSYDRVGVAKAKRRAARMLKALGQFEADYSTQFPDADELRTKLDLSWLGLLRRRPEAVWLAASAIARANRGKQSVQREFLYHRLCGAWLDHFGATVLAFSRPPRGWPPYGPLIGFIMAAVRHVANRLPLAETVSNVIKRERRDRESARQLSFDLRQRRMVD